MASRSISQLLRTQVAPMARQRSLPAFSRHVSLNWSRRTPAFALRGMSTETPASEEKGDSTASVEENAKPGAPPVVDSKEDSVSNLKEERDDLVVRLYLNSSLLACLHIASLVSPYPCVVVRTEPSTVCPSRPNERATNRQRRKRKDARFRNHAVCIGYCRDGGHTRHGPLVVYALYIRFTRHCTHQCDRTYASFAHRCRAYAQAALVDSREVWSIAVQPRRGEV